MKTKKEVLDYCKKNKFINDVAKAMVYAYLLGRDHPAAGEVLCVGKIVLVEKDKPGKTFGQFKNWFTEDEPSAKREIPKVPNASPEFVDKMRKNPEMLYKEGITKF